VYEHRINRCYAPPKVQGWSTPSAASNSTSRSQGAFPWQKYALNISSMNAFCLSRPSFSAYVAKRCPSSVGPVLPPIEKPSIPEATMAPVAYVYKQ
jgi:hypothetical protein